MSTEITFEVRGPGVKNVWGVFNTKEEAETYADASRHLGCNVDVTEKILPSVDTSAFEANHLRKPRGRGVWAFAKTKSHWRSDLLLTRLMTYSEACDYAKEHFRGCSVIYVLP